MIRSMSSALSGLRNHQVMLDVVGNDIANVSTVGFKSSSVVRMINGIIITPSARPPARAEKRRNGNTATV